MILNEAVISPLDGHQPFTQQKCTALFSNHCLLRDNVQVVFLNCFSKNFFCSSKTVSEC